MGRPGLEIYGDADVGSAIQDIEKIVDKIKTNKFSNDDLVNLFNANNELLKAVLNNDYKD